ncbi:MAG: amidohydrolase family protein [Pseudomonadota bacterium]|nr:amidohydrolase family protein [Pseudomonadota bacterium]
MAASAVQWDILVKNALVFDGTGAPPVNIDVAVKGGRVVSKGFDLDSRAAKTVIDGTGQWLTPGLLDIHTHFDLEVEIEPGLTEAVRHGTTTAVMSNCSLGVAFGLQSYKDESDLESNPIVDCFARVENMPKSVLKNALDGHITWDNPIDYLRHFKELPLGANVCPMVPHSMLRVEVMGMPGAIQGEPTDEQIVEMCRVLEECMRAGYVGLSTDGLPLHYLANDPHRNERIPAQHATRKELLALGDVVRRHDGIVQFTPNPDNQAATLSLLLMSSGRLYGKPLRMTATAAMDLSANRFAWKGLLRINRFINSRFMRGKFAFQALSAPFTVYGDGTTTPFMEEKPAFRELNALDLEDREGRQKLLRDPAFQERFRGDWMTGKRGFNLARLARIIGVEPTTFNRNLEDMTLVSVPDVPGWAHQNMGEIYRRLETFQATGGKEGARDDVEAAAFAKFPNPIGDDAEFMMHLLREYDRDFRWCVTTANQRPEVLKQLLLDENTLPGFNDSGAHLTNMAFFDCNLRTLKMAQEDGLEVVSRQVKRLTRDPAELFNLDVGTMEMGAQADLVLIDPEALRQYDSEANTLLKQRKIFNHPQMVNRSDGVVTTVIIAGKVAWDGKRYTKNYGKETFGRVLTRRGVPTPYPHEAVITAAEADKVAATG